MKLLLDTSVLSAYFDERQPERMALTKEFWKNIKNYDVFISEITIQEINLITDKKIKSDFLKLIQFFKILKISLEVKSLTQNYIAAGIIPQNYINDAIQIATASANKIDVLVSWNFRHMVNRKVETKINAINVLRGYPQIDIAAPGELL